MLKKYYFLVLGVLILNNCNSKKMVKVSTNSVVAKKEKYSKSTFDSLLALAQIKPSYVFTSEEEKQSSAFPKGRPINIAFQEGINALFTDRLNSDNFVNMVMGDPEAFGLNNKATPNQIKDVILTLIREDKKFSIELLPINIVETQNLFPPENGEKPNNYWIWQVKCSFFPGPYWMLIKRDGTIPAYSYGYL